MTKAYIKKVAVLGAGVMGAQIAAQLTNANVQTFLFDLPAKEGPLNGIVDNALKRLTKLKPAPFMSKTKPSLISPANYETDLAKLGECDLIIEAIAERLDWKEDLYQKIAPYVKDTAILASNTSGLSIESLAGVLPENLRPRFCGIHFFNPPRYMKLVELIANQQTETSVLNHLESFLVTTLGKGVIHAKDTPNFIANRVGVFAMLAVIHHAEQFDLAFDDVDALTGPLLGRPKSATYRLADVVGLDTLGHVVNTMADNLPNDPWHKFYTVPAFITALVEQGACGQKSGAGIYKKQGKQINVLDAKTGEYKPAQGQVTPEVLAILKIKNPQEKFAALRASEHKQAQFVWATLRDLFLYAAYHLQDIASTARDVDLALRWGFGWKLGPFETWQLADWQAIAGFINEDVAAGKAMANVALPKWVAALSAGPFNGEGAYSPANEQFEPRSSLPVYQRQLFPESVLGEKYDCGATVFESDAVRVWTPDNAVLVIGFKTKGNTINMGVLDGLSQAISLAESDYQGLVIWNPNGPNFSYGADLKMVAADVQAGHFEAVDNVLETFQNVSMQLRYCSVPTVAAVRGMVLGGGCELSMHCDKVVAAAETYVGLVEAGVGILPAGGGTKEFARRAAQKATHNDLDKHLADAFSVIAMAKVSGSALEAVELGYLRDSDVIVFNSDEILHVAMAQVKAMSESAYRPPLPTLIPVGGIASIANRKLMLVNMLEGQFISAHDNVIGEHIANVLCGGEIDKASLVDEKWLLRLEREGFISLLKCEKTLARIEHTLTTGKALRN